MATAATKRLVEWLAAPGWMLAFFVFAFASGLISIQRPDWITAAWLAPLGLFSLSLCAAIASRPRFRADAALLGLHLALLALIVLFATARLVYLDGATTLTDGGEAFDGRLDVDRRGPWHPDTIKRLRFANEGVAESFHPGQRWPQTENRVRWWLPDGSSHTALIANDTPLLLDGYRIYPTFNRGYSPVFQWLGDDGHNEMGSVQLRVDTDFGMANEWSLPNGETVWIMLETEERTRMEPGETRTGLGSVDLNHRLVVRFADQRQTLVPGESIRFAGGTLTYRQLRSWMGYRIVYDPTIPWVTAAALLAVVCMIAYYSKRPAKPLAGKAPAYST